MGPTSFVVVSSCHDPLWNGIYDLCSDSSNVFQQRNGQRCLELHDRTPAARGPERNVQPTCDVLPAVEEPVEEITWRGFVNGEMEGLFQASQAEHHRTTQRRIAKLAVASTSLRLVLVMANMAPVQSSILDAIAIAVLIVAIAVLLPQPVRRMFLLLESAADTATSLIRYIPAVGFLVATVGFGMTSSTPPAAAWVGMGIVSTLIPHASSSMGAPMYITVAFVPASMCCVYVALSQHCADNVEKFMIRWRSLLNLSAYLMMQMMSFLRQEENARRTFASQQHVVQLQRSFVTQQARSAQTQGDN